MQRSNYWFVIDPLRGWCYRLVAIKWIKNKLVIIKIRWYGDIIRKRKEVSKTVVRMWNERDRGYTTNNKNSQ